MDDALDEIISGARSTRPRRTVTFADQAGLPLEHHQPIHAHASIDNQETASQDEDVSNNNSSYMGPIEPSNPIQDFLNSLQPSRNNRASQTQIPRMTTAADFDIFRTEDVIMGNTPEAALVGFPQPEQVVCIDVTMANCVGGINTAFSPDLSSISELNRQYLELEASFLAEEGQMTELQISIADFLNKPLDPALAENVRPGVITPQNQLFVQYMEEILAESAQLHESIGEEFWALAYRHKLEEFVLARTGGAFAPSEVFFGIREMLKQRESAGREKLQRFQELRGQMLQHEEEVRQQEERMRRLEQVAVAEEQRQQAPVVLDTVSDADDDDEGIIPPRQPWQQQISEEGRRSWNNRNRQQQRNQQQRQEPHQRPNRQGHRSGQQRGQNHQRQNRHHNQNDHDNRQNCPQQRDNHQRHNHHQQRHQHHHAQENHQRQNRQHHHHQHQHHPRHQGHQQRGRQHEMRPRRALGLVSSAFGDWQQGGAGRGDISGSRLI